MSSPALPRGWPQHAADALIHAIALARTALAHTHAGFALSPLSHVRLRTQLDRLRTENLQLKEQLRIKDARMARLEPRKRPHYPPPERLAILALRAATGWCTAEIARVFQVCPRTIADWTATVRAGGEQSLVRTPQPINKFPDQVTRLVQSLRATLPTMGRRRVAQTLARAGLHLSATTARRMQEHSGGRCPPPERRRTAVATPPPEKPKASHTVTARHTNHVWSMDFTLMPLFAGFWVPWVPFTANVSWPFCWHVAVIIDHHSRSLVALRAFFRQPSAAQTCKLLGEAVAAARASPKHLVTDQGCQFQGEYLDWCEDQEVQPRFGALGKKGSIAVTERFIRTLKSEGLRRVTLPMTPAGMCQELQLFGYWYNVHRPHQSLGGATPAEVRDGQLPAHRAASFELRGQYPLKDKLTASRNIKAAKRTKHLQLVVSHPDHRTHLPVIELRAAA